MTEFKRGEYYVPLLDDAENNNWNNWVIKQRFDGARMMAEICPNTDQEGTRWYDSDVLLEGTQWRRATLAEIQAYDEFNRPVRVGTIFQPKENYEVY